MSFSPLILGTAQFGLDYGVANKDGKPSVKAVRQMISYAWEHGVSCLDTAADYGDSESIIGTVLQDIGLAGKMRIMSKITHFSEGLSAIDIRDHIYRSIHNSLRKLQVDYLDFCLLHHEKNFHAIDVLAELREEGLINKIGVSFSGVSFSNAEQVFLSPLVDAVQAPGSILDRRIESMSHNLPPECATPLFVRSLYLQGLLLMQKSPPHLQKVQPLLDKIDETARSFGISRKSLCVRYALGISGAGGILLGADNLTQLKENIALAAQDTFSSQQHQEVIRDLPMPAEEVLCPALWES